MGLLITGCVHVHEWVKIEAGTAGNCYQVPGTHFKREVAILHSEKTGTVKFCVRVLSLLQLWMEPTLKWFYIFKKRDWGWSQDRVVWEVPNQKSQLNGVISSQCQFGFTGNLYFFGSWMQLKSDTVLCTIIRYHAVEIKWNWSDP